MNVEEALVEALAAGLRQRYPHANEDAIEAGAKLIYLAATTAQVDLTHVLMLGVEQRQMMQSIMQAAQRLEEGGR